MVGKRQGANGSGAFAKGNGSSGHHQQNQRQHGAREDIENGSARHHGSSRPPPKFRDVVHAAMNDRSRRDLKQRLTTEVGRGSFERFRRPREEIKKMGNKKVREFYENQNERLNDWLEVDSLVMAMAEGVLDSMNPQDIDNDGVAESGGALQGTGEDIVPLLPDDEREQRRSDERKAKWAINVSWRGDSTLPEKPRLLLPEELFLSLLTLGRFGDRST